MSIFVNSPSEAIQAVTEEFDKLTKQLDASTAEPAKPIPTKIPKMDEFQWGVFTRSGYSTNPKHMARCFVVDNDSRFQSRIKYTQAFKERVLSVFDTAKTLWLESCEEFVVEMTDAIEHNKLQKERIISMMQRLGIHQHYSTWEYKTSRSKTKTESRKTSGFIEDLNRVYKTNCLDYEMMLRRVETLRAEIVKLLDVKIKEFEAAEREKAAKVKAKEDERKLIVLAIKYGLETDNVTADDVLDTVIDKCKYLKLAAAMFETRQDWTDGFYRVENAINAFTLEKEIDAEIDKEISDILEGGEDDGRIFRDCKYNYSVIFQLTEPELLSDYETAKGLGE